MADAPRGSRGGSRGGFGRGRGDRGRGRRGGRRGPRKEEEKEWSVNMYLYFLQQTEVHLTIGFPSLSLDGL